MIDTISELYHFQFSVFLEPAKQIIRSTKGWSIVGFLFMSPDVQ